MRVNLFTNTLPRYQAKNNTQQGTNPNTNSGQTTSYMTNAQPSFGRQLDWFGIATKKAIDPAEQIAKRIDDIVKDKKIDLEWHPIKYEVEKLQELTNEETVPFVNKLIDIMTPRTASDNISYNISEVNSIAEQYNRYPSSRPTIQHALDLISKNDNSNLTLFKMNETFGYSYSGSKMQNRFINKVLDAKGFDGKPRFNGFSTFGVFENYTLPEQEQAFDLILHKTVVGDEKISMKKLAGIIEESSVKGYAKNSQNAVIPGKKEFLAYSEHCFADILKHVNPETLPVLKTILPFANESGEISTVLEHYTPAKKVFFDKGMKLVEKGDLSLYELGESLEYAHKQ